MARNPVRGSGALAAIAILGLTHPARADKVGVAAAVNPDAFLSLAGKPQSQINIGKSIFTTSASIRPAAVWFRCFSSTARPSRLAPAQTSSSTNSSTTPRRG